MDAFLSSSWYNNPSFANTHYSSMPFSLLVEEQGLHPAPFTPSSPSLDMEEALQHLSSSCDSELSGSPNSNLDEPDVLMVDPFLDYLNERLMEEGEEDVPCKRHDVEASYHAILSSLYAIMGEYSPLDSTSSEQISAFDLSRRPASSYNAMSIHENVSGLFSSHPWDKSSHHDLHADTTNSYSGLSSHIIGVSNNSRPSCSDLDLILEQKKAGTLCAKHEVVQNSSSQAHSGPLKTAHDRECAVVGGFSDFSFNNGRKAQDQEQTSNFDHLLSNDKSTLKPSSVDILSEEFKDLYEFKYKAGYADLYLGKHSLSDTSASTGRASSLNGDKKKSSRAARKGSQSVRNGSAEVVGLVDLRELLVSCAQAVGMGDVKNASRILQELYQVHGASIKGNSLQRTAHYFCDALVARMGGMGGHQYRIMCENMPSVVSFLKASRIWYGVAPYMKIMHYFANQNILKAAEGALRLHILDYGIFYGMQWPCLINALADREGGPPLLVITGIDRSKPGENTLEWLEESGRRLAAYARTCNVPFQFHAIVSDRWEDIDPASLHLQESEVLVVNCMKRLRHHADESVDSTLTISPRQRLLMSMHSLNPHLLLLAEINSACNSPFFVSRFREALYFYSNIIDMFDTVWGDDPDRRLIETGCYSCDILNIVGCEGAERVERPETYRQWDVRIKKAGFEVLSIPSVIMSRSRSYVKKHYHKDFLVHDDANGWMLLGWKGRTMLAISAWKPSLIK